MGVSKQNHMLDLLDRAYSVPEDAKQFDALLESAHIYFFDGANSRNISPDLPRYAGLDPHIENHVERLERLMSRAEAQPKLGLSLSHHAQITVAETGAVLSLNTCAQDLFGIKRAAYLEGLPLTHDSLSGLRKIIQEIRAGVEQVERILYLQTDTEPQKSVFAFCRTLILEDEHLADSRAVHISLSEFEWSNNLLNHLETALGLSESEGHVLRGVLNGQSQKDIAQARGRSVDTIKAQAKAVLRKAGCAKMTDLAHLCTSISYVIGLSELAHPPQTPEEWVTPKQNLRTLKLKTGRTLVYYEYGDPKGRPILFIHGLVYGPFFLDSMKQGFLKAGLRVICPSRAGFGYTDPEAKGANYDRTVISDTLALTTHLRLSEPLLMAAHQGGGSHAFRIAKALDPLVSKLILIGAGIPITAKHMKHMDAQTRTIAAAGRHAPSVMKMIAGLAVKSYRKRGMRAYLARYFKDHAVDYRSLEDPAIHQKLAEGYYHLVQQGPDVFVKDGMAAMADWTADFDDLPCPQHWIHGEDCPVMNAQYLKDYVQRKTNYPVDLLPDTGVNILYQRPDILLAELAKTVNS